MSRNLESRKKVMPVNSNTMRTNRNSSVTPENTNITINDNEDKEKEENYLVKTTESIIEVTKQEGHEKEARITEKHGKENENDGSQVVYTRNHPGLRKAILTALVEGIWENQEAETKYCLMRILPEIVRMGDFEFNHEKLRLAKAVREVYDDHEMDEDDLKDALVLLKKLRALGFCLRKIRKGPWDHPEEDGTIANHG